MYKNNLSVLQELKKNTELCTSNVTAESLHQTASNMVKRVNACVADHGGHFQHNITLSFAL
jgi:hypothetical protein